MLALLYGLFKFSDRLLMAVVDSIFWCRGERKYHPSWYSQKLTLEFPELNLLTPRLAKLRCHKLYALPGLASNAVSIAIKLVWVRLPDGEILPWNVFAI